MRHPECPREAEVLRTVESGGWQVESDLDLHVHTCGVCGDLVQVAQSIREDQRLLRPEARLQPAAAIWWRSQLRARREAAQRVNRPITTLQAFAAACAVAVALALGGFLIPSLREWFQDLSATVLQQVAPVLYDASNVMIGESPIHGLALLVLAAGLLTVPVVVYLILSDR